MMFASRTEIRDHIQDRSVGWYDQLVNDGSVSPELLADAIDNDGELEIGYDFGTLTIDAEGYITAWDALNTYWYGED